MTDEDHEAALAAFYKRSWTMMIYGLSIWGWLFIAALIFTFMAYSNPN